MQNTSSHSSLQLNAIIGTTAGPRKLGFLGVPCIEQEIKFLFKASDTGCPSGPKSLVSVQILGVHSVKVW